MGVQTGQSLVPPGAWDMDEKRRTMWRETQDVQHTPIYAALLSFMRAAAGSRLLDVACGAGGGVELAHSLGIMADGLDGSPGFTADTQQRVPAATIYRGDLTAPECAMAVKDGAGFGGRSYDAIISVNGLQFSPDPALAVTNLLRYLQPGGRLGIATWAEPYRSQAVAVMSAMRGFGPTPTQPQPGPFSLSEGNAVGELLEAAGLKRVSSKVIGVSFFYRDHNELLNGYRGSVVAAKAEETAGVDAVVDAITRAAAPFRRPDGSYLMNNQFRLTVGTK